MNNFKTELANDTQVYFEVHIVDHDNSIFADDIYTDKIRLLCKTDFRGYICVGGKIGAKKNNEDSDYVLFKHWWWQVCCHNVLKTRYM